MPVDPKQEGKVVGREIRPALHCEGGPAVPDISIMLMLMGKVSRFLSSFGTNVYILLSMLEFVYSNLC